MITELWFVLSREKTEAQKMTPKYEDISLQFLGEKGWTSSCPFRRRNQRSSPPFHKLETNRTKYNFKNIKYTDLSFDLLFMKHTIVKTVISPPPPLPLLY